MFQSIPKHPQASPSIRIASLARKEEKRREKMGGEGGRKSQLTAALKELIDV